MDFLSDFILDFLVFVSLFAAFYLAVAGVKVAVFYVKKRFGKFFRVRRAVKIKPQKRKKPAAIRSIEINPEEVDRIYVKKIS